jgi:transglutaminase-like putative cysteine protease
VAALLVGGALAVSLRLYNRYELALTRGDTVWRLSYDISFRAPRAGIRLRAAVPDDGRHHRVFRQDLRYSGLNTERLRPARTETRELGLITQREGEFHLTARFDIHLSPRTDFHVWTSPVVLSADERAAYLRSTRAIPCDAPIVLETLQRFHGQPTGKRELVVRLFEYCHNQILASEDDGPSDVASVLEERTGTALGRARALAALCRGAKVPARLVAGFVIREAAEARPQVWVEVLTNAHWEPFDPDNGYAGQLPLNFLPARHDGADLVRAPDVKGLNVEYSITSIPPPGGSLGSRGEQPINILDLTRLPLEMHEVVMLLLLMPLGALVTAVFRTLIGIPTFGTFTPVLLALSFVYADWRTGLVVFGVVIALGLVTRAYLDRLKLLMVPRLSVILTLVVMCIVFAVSLLNYLGWTPGDKAVLLPMVILTMTVERFYLSSEEDGARFALQLMAGTLVVGFCCYLVLRWDEVGRMLLAYPEVHLFTVAVLVLMGRYTGYRLSELWRFRDFGSGPSDINQVG